MTEFKTAEELGIEQWEHKQLQALLTLLPTYAHVEEVYDAEPTGFEFNFNMNYAIDNGYACGTVMCIGGACYINEHKLNPLALTEEQVTNTSDYVNGRTNEALDKLYFPHNVDDWESITPNMAVEAIRNFLTYGDPKWTEIVPQATVEE